MNWPEVYMCPLHPEPPAHLPSHPVPPGFLNRARQWFKAERQSQASHREAAEPAPPTPGPCPRAGLTPSEDSGLPAAGTLRPLALSLLEQPPLVIGRSGCTNTPAPAPLRRDTEA